MTSTRYSSIRDERSIISTRGQRRGDPRLCRIPVPSRMSSFPRLMRVDLVLRMGRWCLFDRGGGVVQLAVSVVDITPGQAFIPFHFGYFDSTDGRARAANELTIGLLPCVPSSMLSCRPKEELSLGNKDRTLFDTTNESSRTMGPNIKTTHIQIWRNPN